MTFGGIAGLLAQIIQQAFASQGQPSSVVTDMGVSSPEEKEKSFSWGSAGPWDFSGPEESRVQSWNDYVSSISPTFHWGYLPGEDNGEDVSYGAPIKQILGPHDDDYENTYRSLFGLYGQKNPPVRINGQEFVRIGDDPWLGFGTAGHTAEPNEMINALVDSGYIFYDPKWGYVVPQSVHTAIAQQFGNRDSLLDSVLGNMPQILAGSFLGGAGMLGLSGGAGVATLSAADTAALAAMGTEAGLSGAALDAFIASGGALGSTAGAAGGMLGNIPASLLRGAAQGSISSLLSGTNPLEGAARGALTGGATSGLGQAIDAGMDAITPQAQSLAEGMLPPLAAPESVDAFLSTVPETVPGTELPAGGRLVDITAPGAIEAAIASGNLHGPGASLAAEPAGSVPASPEGPTDLVQEPSTGAVTGERYVQLAKQAQGLYRQLFGSQQVPAFELPKRQEGQSDEDYAAEVGQYAVDYLSLDPEAMREAGLEPGTPEYLDYILEQADKIIAAVFGENAGEVIDGATVEDLQAALRDKTQEEGEALIRALFVRGSLGQLTMSGTVQDPFTGISEEIGVGGKGVKGAEAGRERGYARFLQDILGMSGPESAEAMKGLLNREVDLFGLESSAKARKLADMLEQDQPLDKKRRGMLGDAGDFWLNQLESMDPKELQRILAVLGGDSEQGSAIEDLLGMGRG